MLAVHWSPVSNTKKILKNGITKSKNGVYCFPLTGHKAVDAWWVKAFNLYKFRKDRKVYNGFIFKIKQNYMPAYFGHWIGATGSSDFQKPLITIEDLETEIRNTLLWRLGEKLSGYQFDIGGGEKFISLAEEEIKKNPKAMCNAQNDLGLMMYIFEDCQIVLENSIPASDILKIISSRDEFGRVEYKRRKNEIEKDTD